MWLTWHDSCDLWTLGRICSSVQDLAWWTSIHEEMTVFGPSWGLWNPRMDAKTPRLGQTYDHHLHIEDGGRCLWRHFDVTRRWAPTFSYLDAYLWRPRRHPPRPWRHHWRVRVWWKWYFVGRTLGTSFGTWWHVMTFGGPTFHPSRLDVSFWSNMSS
jgi:hypothetical protein